jgi:hypothetical protein
VPPGESAKAVVISEAWRLRLVEADGREEGQVGLASAGSGRQQQRNVFGFYLEVG